MWEWWWHRSKDVSRPVWLGQRTIQENTGLKPLHILSITNVIFQWVVNLLEINAVASMEPFNIFVNLRVSAIKGQASIAASSSLGRRGSGHREGLGGPHHPGHVSRHLSLEKVTWSSNIRNDLWCSEDHSMDPVKVKILGKHLEKTFSFQEQLDIISFVCGGGESQKNEK